MKKPILVALFALAASSLGGPAARAQIDPYRISVGVYQNDVLVGEVWRDGVDPARYTEHWVLSARYVYPSERNRVTPTLRPSGRAYENLRDFLARVPWADGSRYVVADCADGTTIPRLR